MTTSNRPKESLSYSSCKELFTCEQKFFHRKVAETPVDFDYEESDSLGMGKAFHLVMEETKHSACPDDLIEKARKEFEVDPSETALLKSMLQEYVKYHKAMGLEVVRCELGIQTPEFEGYIDAIAQGTQGWWIIDLKTAARWDEKILGRLPKDLQLNLYAYFAEFIQSSLDLKGPFLGCRYRVITKTKQPKVYDVEVPASTMNPKEAWAIHTMGRERAKELRGGEVPKKNFNACFDYFRPCAYFSKCHGVEFSKANKQVTLHTMDSLKEGDIL